jgi:hypothetical protein
MHMHLVTDRLGPFIKGIRPRRFFSELPERMKGIAAPITPGNGNYQERLERAYPIRAYVGFLVLSFAIVVAIYMTLGA